MTSGTTKTETKPVQKRQDFRVATSLELRLRPSGSSPAAAGPDPVALFEDLSLAQTRFRKELGPAGRAFIDKLMTTIDALAGIAAAAQGDDGWSEPIQGQADLSAGGLGFVVPDSLVVSSEYELEFSLPESGTSVPFRCEGVVVRCDARPGGGFNCGVAFTGLSPSTERRLIRVVLEFQRVQLRSSGGTE